MEPAEYFADTYRGARVKFLAACRAQQVEPTSLRAEDGAGDKALPLVECVRLGNPAATHILAICGGDRLVDALCGSGIVIGWISEFAKARLPGDTAIVLLHHGPIPATGGEALAVGRPQPVWEDDLLANVEKRYAEYARRKGVDAMGAPLAVESRPDLPGYPRAVLDTLARKLDSATAGRIVFADIRVSLGPYGRAEITPCHAPESTAAKRVWSWFSTPGSAQDKDAGTQEPDSLAAGLMRRFPGTDVTAFSAAFGTYSMTSVLDSLASRPDGTAVPDPRNVLFPREDAWRDAVWRSAIIVLQRALTAIHTG